MSSIRPLLHHLERPIILLSNSSWYLHHYRKYLLKSLAIQTRYVIALSPVDSSTPSLLELVLHVPWRVTRTPGLSSLTLLKSFIRLFLLVRALKPSLLHSHTVKANLLASISTSFLGIPCVYSFAGLGRLSLSKGTSRFIFLAVLRVIAYFATHQRSSRWTWFSNLNRSRFIFQNPRDLKLFQSIVPPTTADLCSLIPGSGLPNEFTVRSDKHQSDWVDRSSTPSKITLIFCARLLISKGIKTFLEIAALHPNHDFIVYGSGDPGAADSLTNSILASYSHLENLKFLGRVQYPLLLPHSYPVLLVPSNYGEGFPRSIVEAMSQHIPVISSSQATCGLFSDQYLYIPEDDSPSSYSLAIDELLRDFQLNNLVHRLRASKEYAVTNFREEQIVSKTLDLYEDLLCNSSRSYMLTKALESQDSWLP